MARMAKKRGKIGVTNEKIMEILSGMKEKVDNTDSLMEIQSRHSGRLEKEMSSIGSRVKRFETVVEKSMSALEERMNEIEGAIKTVVEWGAMKSDLQDFATRNDIERMKGEIIEPIIKAVDKDAETVINHGRRITVLERRAGIAAK